LSSADDTTFRFLVEHSPDGVFVVVDAAFVFLNDAARGMFGLDADADPIEETDVLHPSEHERARRNMALRASGVLRGAATYLARRPDGSTFPIEVHAAPLQYRGSKGLHGVIRDITARRKMEETLEQMERSTVVSRLAAGFAHDFNNLLAVIQTSTEVAQREAEDNPQIAGALTRIRAAVQRGGEKVRHIQQMGAHTRDSEVDLRPIHLNPVVEDVLELTRARWQDEAESSGIRYDVRWQPDQPPSVRAAPSDLRAALVALVFNAVEAMPRGGSILIKTGETNDGEAMITVRDTGEGVQPDDLQKLTDAFFTTRTDRRMGLGLHLVQSVLERHGGRLEVDSTRGQGSTFALILPASDVAPSEPPPEPRHDLLERATESTEPAAPSAPTRSGRSVLIVDDQADLVHVVRTILEGRGYAVDTALNGRDGVAAAEASRYSVILTDLGMPDISGWDVAGRVRQVHPDVPIVLMTGWAADIPPDRLREHEIQALLPKPFRSDQLLAVINQVLIDAKRSKQA